jgi:hypothetical protein
MDHFYQGDSFGENWFTYPELYSELVRSLPQESVFVEIGSWKGRSSAFFAVEAINSKKNIKFYAIDTWRGSEEHTADEHIINDTLYDLFLKNISPVSHFITPIRKPSVEAAGQFQDESVDAVFIDGDHSYEGVKQDIAAWIGKVKSGGVICGHDYLLPSVKQAVDEYFGDSVQFRNAMENCWIVKVESE